jgi:hypothetical protein
MDLLFHTFQFLSTVIQHYKDYKNYKYLFVYCHRWLSKISVLLRQEAIATHLSELLPGVKTNSRN